ncbi:MAG: dihydrofolate reductase family protein [Bryobacteraceae bacterium]
MRKVIYLVAASLDGKIARRDGSFDCFLAEGDHVAGYLAALDTFDDVLMGRGTYEVALRAGVTDPYPKMTSHVFSRTMEKSPDAHVHLVREGAAEYVAALKQQPGRDIYLCGAAGLAAELLEAGLIDEVAVKLNPLLAGDGIPIFERVGEPRRLDLVDVKRYVSGVVLLTYRVP